MENFHLILDGIFALIMTLSFIELHLIQVVKAQSI